jgi:uncharacterized integral membrane protein
MIPRYRNRATWQIWLGLLFDITLATFALYSLVEEYDPLWVVFVVLAAIDGATGAAHLVRRRVLQERIDSGER